MNACLFCNRPIKNNLSISFLFSWKKLKNQQVCIKCAEKFEKIDRTHACLGCSRQQSNKSYCKDCKKWREQYPNLRLNHNALYTYNEMAREFMDQYKFQGDLLLADIFSEQMHEALNKYQASHFIVPIPLSPLSKQTRGFNQVQLLLKRAGIVYQSLLENNTKEPLQSSKNRLDRLKTPQPFQIMNEEVLKGNSKNKILIIDDVYTTGRTMLHAKEVFKQSFSDHFEIESFSLFR